MCAQFTIRYHLIDLVYSNSRVGRGLFVHHFCSSSVLDSASLHTTQGNHAMTQHNNHRPSVLCFLWVTVVTVCSLFGYFPMSLQLHPLSGIEERKEGLSSVLVYSQENSSTATLHPSATPTNNSSNELTVDTFNSSSRNLTIVIQLSGELGNHLAKMATGAALALEWKARVRHGNVQLLLQRQEHTTKGERVEKQLQTCFPYLLELFQMSSTIPDLDEQLERLQSHLVLYDGKEVSLASVLDRVNSYPPVRVDETLDWLAKHWNDLSSSPPNTPSSTISTYPFLYANHLAELEDLYVKRHYSALRRLLTMSTTSECQPRPPNDGDYDILVHYRNFLYEMPRKGRNKGYQELSPTGLAQYLLRQAKNGTRVGILTRFPDGPSLHNYTIELERVGFQVNVITSTTNASSTLDFGRLVRTKKDTLLVGFQRSTFFVWAALLGLSERVLVYSIAGTTTGEYTRLANQTVAGSNGSNSQRVFRMDIVNETSGEILGTRYQSFAGCDQWSHAWPLPSSCPKGIR